MCEWTGINLIWFERLLGRGRESGVWCRLPVISRQIRGFCTYLMTTVPVYKWQPRHTDPPVGSRASHGHRSGETWWWWWGQKSSSELIFSPQGVTCSLTAVNGQSTDGEFSSLIVFNYESISGKKRNTQMSHQYLVWPLLDFKIAFLFLLLPQGSALRKGYFKNIL